MKPLPTSRPSIGPDELAAVEKVFASGWLGMGSTVKEFEEAIGRFLDPQKPPAVVAVNTGTTALHLVLDALGIGAGDEVIMPSLTFVATAQAVLAAGAKPVFCDVDPVTLNMDPASVRRAITPNTRALIPVHYRGESCAMAELSAIARERKIRIVEDAAHAFGSSYNGQLIGSFGDVVCFSFDPIKNLTCGEGGAIVTRDAALASSLQAKRILGIDKDTWSRYRNERLWQYDVTMNGFRYHMSNINAAIGLVQLGKFARMQERKNAIAVEYDAAFGALSSVRLIPTDYRRTAVFSYIVLIERDRANAIEFLKERGIGTGIHYQPVHTFSRFRQYIRAELPVTDLAAGKILTLPLFCDMTDDDRDRVITALTGWDRT